MRELTQCKHERDVSLDQKEAAIEEMRAFKESSARDATAARIEFERKLATLTERAFKLADPEVKAYVCVAFPKASGRLLSCVGMQETDGTPT
jgi:hypothetical protein